jgi:hypothetical protein
VAAKYTTKHSSGAEMWPSGDIASRACQKFVITKPAINKLTATVA